MSKSKSVILYFALALVFISGIMLYVITSPKGDVITIKSDGRIIEQIDLKTVSEEYEIQVNHNGFNKIRITQSCAEVFDADCPDKLCIEQSKSGIYPIVCLPHKLIIEKNNRK